MPLDVSSIAASAGCPNSNDFGGDKVLHHTVGEVDFSQELRCAFASCCTAL